ncbi:MAG: IclR family transcriptional regulator [Anaerolineae bacterium]|nr:IclR family transcriptional regulator [Anaerolineae bacterium]
MSKGVQSVERAFALLELLGGAVESMGLSELALHSDLPMGTVHRLLNTMVSLGYVEQDHETRKYALGIRLLHLRGAVTSRLNLGAHAMPIMKSLMRRVNETVHLAVLNQGEVVYIDRVEGFQTLGMYTQIGKRAPVHCTALGKVLLAHAAEDVLRQAVERHGLPRHTAKTLTEVEALRADLACIRERGYALDDEESEYGVRCVAAPVRDYRGNVIAAVSISGPAARVRPERDPELGAEVCWAAQRISEGLGYISPRSDHDRRR